MNKSLKITLVAVLVSISSFGQNAKGYSYKIHSHNDYMRDVPFWEAYANKASSIEVDIVLKNDTLYVAHETESINSKKTLKALYLKPISKAFSLSDKERSNIQLLVDLKNKPYATLEKLIILLKEYKYLLKTGDKKGLSIVISGRRPAVSDYNKYPDFITFDYQKLDDIPQESWSKVGLISLDFQDFSEWNGKGRLTAEDYIKVNNVIQKAHAYQKPFRFWGTPDSKTSWKVFAELGVDFINTDMPYKATKYLKTLNDNIYKNGLISKVYTPTFKSDKKNSRVKNIILLIGDGNGLTQISAATLANGGQLTLTQLKSIGFLKTQSGDDFSTDSAAGGTALATGEKTYNRAIGVDVDGNTIKNITEVLDEHSFASGCITTDHITGATPAAFYAHQKDRSEIENIAGDLTKSKLSLFVGGGKKDFSSNKITSKFAVFDSIDQIGSSKKEKVGYFLSYGGVPGIIEGRGNILAQATKNGLQFLSSKKKSFFLMVESSGIDSYGHLNNVEGIITEGIDFDKAITEAIKFADENKNTLVIITADHETSGFSIPQGNVKKHTIEGDFISHDHTGVMVPLFAYGPQSDKFQGVYENNELFYKILNVLDIKR